LLLVLAEQCSIVPVEGWSHSNFVKRCGTRQNTNTNALAPWNFSSRKQSHLKLETTNGFFEDPSKVMQNQSNATAIATENDRLRDSVRQLEEENERLKTFVEQQHQKELEMAAAAARKTTTNKQIILETFEGEHLFDSVGGDASSQSSFAIAGEEGANDDDEMWCDVLDGDECPLEPAVSFGEALRDRAYWLVGLLVMQSLSGIILAQNEMLLTNHPVIIYYLTMMVGAGGNAGNQASVRVIRGIALGTLNERTRGQFLIRELKMAATLSIILSVAGFARTICFRTPLPEAVTVTAALSLIVFISVCLGAVLPLVLERIGVDPAHSSTTIQVIMDILGVLLAVVVSGAILDGPLGAYLLPKLGY